MSHTLDVTKLDDVFETLESDYAVRKLSANDSDWVGKFREQYDRLGKLSEKQLEILEGIYIKV